MWTKIIGLALFLNCAMASSLSSSTVAAAEGDSNVASSMLVPQLSEHGITEQDLATSIRVLNAISSLDPKKNKNKKRKASSTNDDTVDNTEEEDGLTKYKQPNLRQFRKSLSATLSLHQQTMYNGKSELQYYEQRIAERTLKRQKMAERAQQKKYVATTDLRKGRVEKLERLKDEGKEEEDCRLLQFLIPDGHVDTNSNTDIGNGNGNGDVKMIENGNNNNNNAAKCEEKKDDDDEEENVQLPKLKSCYVCKVRFRTLHHFYDQLCPDCAPYNWNKRHQTADLSNKVAIVTGSRVKIGYQVCLKLLRAGCTVVATTRFPNNAVFAYRKENDWDVWKDRLHVYALDLRDVTGLEAFTRYLKVTFGQCDILINNACQTIRRPGGYYLPLVEKESEIWNNGDDAHKRVLKGCIEFERIRRRLVEEHNTADGGQQGGNFLPTSAVGGAPVEQHNNLLHDTAAETATLAMPNVEEENDKLAMVANGSSQSSKKQIPFESTGISHSAAMSQMAMVPEDVGVDEKVMPR